MALLSILIPVTQIGSNPASLVGKIVSRPEPALEIVLSASRTTSDALGLADLAATDDRIRLAISEDGVTPAMLWRAALLASSGDWVSLVGPLDMIEPELIGIIRFLAANQPETDGFAWNALQIAADAVAGKASSVAIPTSFGLVDFDKTDMLKAFFLWENSHNIPKMPFGLHHAALNRRLAITVQDSIDASGRKPAAPQWEWAARTVLMGEKFVFTARPLSVVDQVAYRPPALAGERPGFPFHAGLGLTAGIAEAQDAVFAEMGAAWLGMEENFIRALTIDAMLESEPAAFNAKCNAYFSALKRWQGGRFAGLFKPQFAGQLQPDRRRGLVGSTIMIDRHIAGAENAQDFYDVIRHFVVPVGLMTGGQTL